MNPNFFVVVVDVDLFLCVIVAGSMNFVCRRRLILCILICLLLINYFQFPVNDCGMFVVW